MTRFPIRPELWACAVVIHEVSSTSVKRTKITKAHIGLNLHVILSSEMIHRGRPQFVLEGTRS